MHISSNAFFSDGTEYYRSPSEPKEGDTVKIRFRTQKNNVDAVYLICDGKRKEMYIADTSKGFDYLYKKLSIHGSLPTNYN